MKILIIEDEARIARRLQRMTAEFFGSKAHEITVCDSLQKGIQYVASKPLNLLLLDLNLNGDDGFQVLERMVACSFHTIIVSAYTDKAITAFAYGVIDFVPKPFDEDRLFQALKRCITPSIKPEEGIKYLSIKKAGQLRLVGIAELNYIKGAGIYTELHLKNGEKELHDKSLEHLQQLLPANFERIHKSYLVNLELSDKVLVSPGSKYGLLLKSGETLPIGRSKYKELKSKII
ncbi:LytR/AlgR family response regulator transcription factor [Pedobacter insulae]|uniref:DNA-binding response regulator, LytR/AlgR family n=1 Tax=Pedobacter insulae TaxID=414048 RepID=A0A1I2WTS8_9SPHI|nr:response regulator transcription factor [Pedobacter insulae]SFH03989.1 DNA-binding response regulator, LytR/AlgR family [Pedobacter insulae]